jgi:hypothetical protein
MSWKFDFLSYLLGWLPMAFGIVSMIIAGSQENKHKEKENESDT